jgi:hypothetical protein
MGGGPTVSQTATTKAASTGPPGVPPAYAPSPTVEQFILGCSLGPREEMRMLILMGPRGEGKTAGGIVAPLALAGRLAEDGAGEVLPVRVAIVRDTWTNLDRTTLVSMDELRGRGLPIEFLADRHEARVKAPGADRELVHWWCFGLDRAEDCDRLQGFQAAVLHLEEVAPAAGFEGGVPAAALGMGAMSLRQPGVPPRLLVTTNPPDDDHWILRAEESLHAAGLSAVRVHRWTIPPGERSAHFQRLAEALAARGDLAMAQAWQSAADEFDRYRERNLAFLESIGRTDLVARLVHGQIGTVQQGTAVVPQFSRPLHVAQAPLPVYPQLPLIRGWDSGTPNLHPACVWMQGGEGWLNVLGSRTGENCGLVEFLRDQVLPFQARYGLVARQPLGAPTTGPARPWARWPGGAGAHYRYRDIGDPACLIPEGTSSQRTVALEIEHALGTAFEPGPVSWTARREALHAAFARKALGDRMFVAIDPTENELLIKALAGRFYYPTNQVTGRIEGTVQAAKRVSGIYSHAVDALAYALATLYPAEAWVQRHQAARAPGAPPPRPATSWVGV